MVKAHFESPYLTADEAAEYLRYPNTHAFRVDIPKKGIPHIKRGRRLFFRKVELDDPAGGRAVDRRDQPVAPHMPVLALPPPTPSSRCTATSPSSMAAVSRGFCRCR